MIEAHSVEDIILEMEKSQRDPPYQVAGADAARLARENILKRMNRAQAESASSLYASFTEYLDDNK